MENLSAIRTIPGLGSGERPKLDTFDDIRKEIVKTAKPDITPAKTIDLGPCGMGMPVLQSKWALNELNPGEILETRSGHPWSYPDIHAWVSRASSVEMVGEDMADDNTIYFYLRRVS